MAGDLKEALTNMYGIWATDHRLTERGIEGDAEEIAKHPGLTDRERDFNQAFINAWHDAES